MQTAPPTTPTAERQEEAPTLSEMLWEVADLAGGAVVTLLPLLVLVVPSAVLFLVLPAVVLVAVAAVPVVVAGAVAVPAYLLARFVMRAGARVKAYRRSAGRSSPAAPGHVGGATC